MGRAVAWGAAGAAALLAFVFVFVVLLGDDAQGACPTGAGAVSVDPSSVPDSIAGYGHDQLVNAAAIIQAGKALNLSARDQTIGVMTAMGESGLRVLAYGDAVGPDSRGLFQQRANGAWGSLADRMDPATSSTNFFKALAGISDRDSLAPTIAAHRVQHNANPDYYAPFWAPARQVVQALSGSNIGLTASVGNAACNGATTTTVANLQGWAKPANGPITSPYGPRVNPVTHAASFHFGTDLGAPCDAPIWAANAGVVSGEGFDNLGIGYIVVDHGGGQIQTKYEHMYASGMLVQIGDHVTAGQQIARVGSSGRSTGCHLHFETFVNGKNVDPAQFMASVGITLG